MADAEAHVMPDGRLYIVGSTDVSGSKDYCSKEIHIWSTDDPELENWIDHGAVYTNRPGEKCIPWAPEAVLYAPDMIHKDGKYYLYMCGSNAFEAAAVAEKPEGPYGEAHRITGADGNGIDPAIFVDDDGSAYYLWGQFHLRGAKLRDNMYELDADTITDNILTEQEHGFHEGASMRKIGSRYYIVYTDISRGRATCLSYAVADSPLGPYKKGGVIIDNTYCDPSTWNDHGSIQFYKGRWFVFYHRSSQNCQACRRVCAEPITVLEDGSIPEVPMTSNGAGKPLNASEEIEASCASRMKGSLFIVPDPLRPGREMLTGCGGGNWTEAWAEFRTADLGSGASRITVKASGKGRITLMTQREGKIASADVNALNGEIEAFSAKLEKSISGCQTVWLLFEGDMDVRTFSIN